MVLIVLIHSRCLSERQYYASIGGGSNVLFCPCFVLLSVSDNSLVYKTLLNAPSREKKALIILKDTIFLSRLILNWALCSEGLHLCLMGLARRC